MIDDTKLDDIRRVAVEGEGGDLLRLLTDDAQEWAAAFCAVAHKLGHDLDEGWVIGWFANAIEHSAQHRRLLLSSDWAILAPPLIMVGEPDERWPAVDRD